MLHSLLPRTPHIPCSPVEQTHLHSALHTYLCSHPLDLQNVVPAAGRSTIVTMAAVHRAGDVDFAAVGLTNMMNAGGAVLDFQLHAGAGASGNGDRAAAGPSATVQVRGLTDPSPFDSRPHCQLQPRRYGRG